MAEIDVKGTIVSDDDGWIYDYFGIENTCPNKVAAALKEANGEDVTIRINSGGGDLFAGNEIYYLIAGYKGKTTVDIIGLDAQSFLDVMSHLLCPRLCAKDTGFQLNLIL